MGSVWCEPRIECIEQFKNKPWGGGRYVNQELKVLFNLKKQKKKKTRIYVNGNICSYINMAKL